MIQPSHDTVLQEARQAFSRYRKQPCEEHLQVWLEKLAALLKIPRERASRR